MIREITVSIENEPGRIHTVAAALGRAGIDILALSVAERETTGVLRLIVSDVPAARTALMELEVPAAVHEVLAAAAADQPGGLATVLAPLTDAALDVRYCYAFRRTGQDAAVVVLSTEDNERATKLLLNARIPLYREETLYA
jgi:hypothetical protein